MRDLARLLENVSFGSRTAEDEMTKLGDYFVETAQWTRLKTGEKDIIYGSKGAGKSAIYAVLIQREDDFSAQGIVIKSGEQARGEPIFGELAASPPESEAEWRLLWRAYFIGLVAEALEAWSVEGEAAQAVFTGLEKYGLREGQGARALLRGALGFVTRLRSLEASADAATGTVKVAGHFEAAPQRLDTVAAAAGVSSLLEEANRALREADLEVWVALDRLDAAFGNPAIEAPAIRALMRVYLDLTTFERITPKIFLRLDIWEELSENDVFREASHLIRDETISWNRDTLLNLATRRALENEQLCERFGVDPEEVLASVERQEELFERFFEGDPSKEFETMLDWAIESIADGHGRSAPRELIHLLGELRTKQIERIQVGRHGPDGEAVFESAVCEPALMEVSNTHLSRTLYAEIPKVKDLVEEMRGGSTTYSVEQLEVLWGDSVDTVKGVIKTLVKAGFLRRLPGGKAGFEVAMLYRPALELSVEAVPENGGSDGD
jgi:hypothetical protein